MSGLRTFKFALSSFLKLIGFLEGFLVLGFYSVGLELALGCILGSFVITNQIMVGPRFKD